jgi:hypothetical protein
MATSAANGEQLSTFANLSVITNTRFMQGKAGDAIGPARGLLPWS